MDSLFDANGHTHTHTHIWRTHKMGSHLLSSLLLSLCVCFSVPFSAQNGFTIHCFIAKAAAAAAAALVSILCPCNYRHFAIDSLLHFVRYRTRK